MAANPKQSRVAESAMQLLIQEIVASIDRTTFALAETEGSGVDTAVLAAHAKLEQLGFDIGQRFVERVSQNRLVQAEPLEAIKFLCKDLWQEVITRSKCVPQLPIDEIESYLTCSAVRYMGKL
jgi:hypothetical protein